MRLVGELVAWQSVQDFQKRRLLGLPTPDEELMGLHREIVSTRAGDRAADLHSSLPMSDEKGATEDEVERIKVIRGTEALGYEGSGREEHSGEKRVEQDQDLESDLADNQPGQVPER